MKMSSRAVFRLGALAAVLVSLGAGLYVSYGLARRLHEAIRRDVREVVRQAVDDAMRRSLSDAVRVALEAHTPPTSQSYVMDRAWGEFGEGIKQFRSPYGTLVDDRRGALYVTECHNYSIHRYTLDGTLVTAWAVQRFDPKGVRGPTMLAQTSKGELLVTVQDNHWVERFTPDGRLLGRFGSLGTGDGQLNRPLGIAVDSQDNVYVADYLNERIQEFDARGKFLRKWGRRGKGDGEFHGVYAVKVDSRGRVYVSEMNNNRIQVFTADGVFLRKWGRNGGDGSAGAGNGEFDVPHEIAIDARDRIYVADTENHRIQVFDSEGRFLAKFGTRAEFLLPKMVAVDAGFNLYVVDVLQGVNFVTRWRPAGAGKTAKVSGRTAMPSFPRRLSEFGMYAALPSLHTTNARARRYTPHWELWSNGARKTRDLVLPEGRVIDTRNRERWEFPEGTLVFKTFAYPDPAAPSSTRPVETRVLRRGRTAWDYAAYRWRGDLSDADLLRGDVPVPVAVSPRPGETFTHVIPSRQNCVTCHISRRTFVLGINELQLNAPLPDHARTQLEEWAGNGMFSQPLPGDPATIVAPDARTRDVIGYVQANCVHCHNPDGRSVDFRSEAFVRNTVGKLNSRRSELLVKPGDPEGSEVVRRVADRTMPPLGVDVPDLAARELFREWVRGLR